MIKKTFYNLPKTKQERIINAIKAEFDRAPIDKISINNIIKEASISRGSFYQYFDDKGDLYDIIADQMVESIRQVYSRSLALNKGDIFLTSNSLINMYFEKNELFSSDKRKEILPCVSTNAKGLVDRIGSKLHSFTDTVISNLDTSKLSITEYDDLKALLELMLIIVRDVTFDYRSKKYPKEQCLNDYQRKMNIIKQGCLKPEYR